MSYLPMCNYGDHFWPKRKALYYVAEGSGADFVRYRLRFCAEHTAIVEEDLLEFEVGAQVAAIRGNQRSTVQCLACGEEVEKLTRQVFITGYPTKDERKDYWGGLHEGHQLPEYLRDRFGV